MILFDGEPQAIGVEVIYAANEGNLPELAKRYALLLSAIDPDVLTVKQILADRK
jgi:hypothetical protein